MKLKAEMMNTLDRVITYQLIEAVNRNASNAFSEDLGCSIRDYYHVQRLNALYMAATSQWFSTRFTNWIYTQVENLKKSKFHCWLVINAKKTFFGPSEAATKRTLSKFKTAVEEATPDIVSVWVDMTEY